MDWVIGCIDINIPPEIKLCSEYICVYLGFYVCSPCSIKIYSLNLDLIMDLSIFFISAAFLA